MSGLLLLLLLLLSEEHTANQQQTLNRMYGVLRFSNMQPYYMVLQFSSSLTVCMYVWCCGSVIV